MSVRVTVAPAGAVAGVWRSTWPRKDFCSATWNLRDKNTILTKSFSTRISLSHMYNLADKSLQCHKPH